MKTSHQRTGEWWRSSSKIAPSELDLRELACSWSSLYTRIALKTTWKVCVLIWLYRMWLWTSSSSYWNLFRLERLHYLQIFSRRPASFGPRNKIRNLLDRPEKLRVCILQLFIDWGTCFQFFSIRFRFGFCWNLIIIFIMCFVVAGTQHWCILKFIDFAGIFYILQWPMKIF